MQTLKRFKEMTEVKEEKYRVTPVKISRLSSFLF